MNYFPDVSKYQGDINFDIMRTKTDYIIFKASQGNSPDPKISRNIAESKRVGLPYGLYHFYDDRYSPALQADTFAALADGAAELWCDWESTYSGHHKTLRDVVAFMERVEELTNKPVGMYTGFYWFIDNSSPISDLARYRFLQERPLWLAAYTDDHTPKNIERVRIPKPWLEMDVWQYGTPVQGYEMGAQSKEIDMNLRLGNPPTAPTVKSTLTVRMGGRKAVYNER